MAFGQIRVHPATGAGIRRISPNITEYLPNKPGYLPNKPERLTLRAGMSPDDQTADFLANTDARPFPKLAEPTQR